MFKQNKISGKTCFHQSKKNLFIKKMASLIARDKICRFTQTLCRKLYGARNCFSVIRRLHAKTVTSFEHANSDYIAIDFNENYRFFETKKMEELARSLAVLKFSSYDTLVKNSLPLMTFAERVLGTKMFESLMKKTMYSQFVAGEDYESIKDSIERLKEHGIGTILCVPTEENFSEETDDFENSESICNRNTEVIHDCIDKTEPGSFSQMKITAVCSPSLLKILSDFIQPYETHNHKPYGLSVDNLARGFDAGTQSHNLVPHLTKNQNKHLINSLKRLDSFAKNCKTKNIRLLIDAEQTYLEGGIHQLTLTLQSKYNKSLPWIYGTYQCYRKDTLDRLRSDLETMSDQGFHFGAKMVRGAYRENEKVRSLELGYENPIHNSYEDTCKAYNTAMEIILQKAACSPAEVMFATHNEESVQLATKRMTELGIDKTDGGVSFAQLYGMCDQVSSLLGQKGYEVYKSVPYGAVNTTLPYLARRAIENRDVISRTAKERSLIWKEIRYRLTGTCMLPSKSKERNYLNCK